MVAKVAAEPEAAPAGRTRARTGEPAVRQGTKDEAAASGNLQAVAAQKKREVQELMAALLAKQKEEEDAAAAAAAEVCDTCPLV